MTNASLIWDESKDLWRTGLAGSEKTIVSEGNTVTVTGDTTGSAAFDSNGNISVSIQVVDDSHNHIISNIDGLQAALDNKSSTTHNHDSVYLKLVGGTLTGDLSINKALAVINAGTSSNNVLSLQSMGSVEVVIDSNNESTDKLFSIKSNSQASTPVATIDELGNVTAAGYNITDVNTKILEGSNNAVRVQTNFGYIDIGPQDTNLAYFNTDRSSFYFNKPLEAMSQLKVSGTNTYFTGTVGYINGGVVWHMGNDGTDSGLDADLLDGQQGSFYQNASNLNTGTLPIARIGTNSITLDKIQKINADTFLGRDTAGTGNIEVLTIPTVKTKLNLSGTNSGDQNIFQTISVPNQSNIVASTTSDTLTLIAGSNVEITTNTTNKSVTINSSYVNTASAADGILQGSNIGTEIMYKPYETQQNTLSFDTSSTDPVRTDRLNLNGALHATQLYEGSSRVLVRKTSDTTISTHKLAFFDVSTGDIVRSKLTFNDSGSSTNEIISAAQVNTRIDNALSSIDTTATINNVSKAFTATESQTIFDISDIYPDDEVGAIVVYLNGVFQLNTADYNVDTTPGSEKIIFTSGCANGDRVVVCVNTTSASISMTAHTHDDMYALINHNHDNDYLKLTGGTLTGNLKISGTTKADGVLYAGTTNPTNTTRLNYDGYFYATQLASTVATGTAPLVVSSTTAVTNLNADMLDGNHASDFMPASLYTAKGDILVALDASTPTKLSIGNDGDVLIVDSNSLTGIKWGSPAATVVNEVIKSSSATLTADEVTGTIICNYGQSTNVTLTLPIATKGLTFMIVLTTKVNNYFRIKPAANDKIYLNGVAGADGKYVGVSSTTPGNAISFASFKADASSYDWIAVPISGNWTAEA